MIDAGTITAWLTLDTSKFKAGMDSANAQLRALKDNDLTVGEKITSVGGALQTIGGTLTNTVTMPLLRLGTSAIKTAAGFDESMSRVAAISGATGDDLDRLREKAREMGSKTKFSASEAADAMSYMAMAGWKTGDMLDGIEGIMNLAAASGEDLATTSDIVTDALTAFGLSAKDSAHFSDILAAASSNANTNVSMMGESFKYCAPIAGAMGYSAEDVAEALGLMANSGIKASQAGTAMRSIMTKLTGELKISGKELGEVTIQTTNTDGSMRELSDILADCRGAFSKLTESEKSQAAEALVGKYAMSGFLSLMNAAPADIDKLSGAIDNCDGAAQRMADVMQDNLNGQLTKLKSQAEEVAIGLGTELMPIAQDLVGVASDVVQWFGELDEGTKKFIVYAGLAAAALGPVTTVLGNVTSGVGNLITTVRTAASVFSPAGLAVIALGGIVAACVAIYEATRDANKGTRELGDAFKGAVDGAKEFYDAVQNGGSVNVSSSFTSTLNSGIDINDLQQKISNTQQKITDIIDKAAKDRRKLTSKELKDLKKYYDELKKLHEEQTKYYTNNLTALNQAVQDGLELNEESAQQILTQGKANMDAALKAEEQAHFDRIAALEQMYANDDAARKAAIEQENSDYKKRVENIRQAYADLNTAVTEGYYNQDVADSEFLAMLKQHNDDVETENQRHSDAMVEAKKSVYDNNVLIDAENYNHEKNMEKLNQQLADSFKGANADMVKSQLGLLTTLQSSHGEITANTQEFINEFLDCYDDLPEDVRKDMDETIAAMNLTGKDGEVIDSMEALCNDLLAITGALPGHMKQRIDQTVPDLTAAVDSMSSAMQEAMRTDWDMHSPSRVMMTMGGNIIDGLNLGMEGKKPNAVSTVNGIMQSMLKAAGSVSFRGIGGNMVSGIISGINAKMPSLVRSASSMASSAISTVRRALGINSPSRVMMEVGRFTAEGMEAGLKQGARDLYATASAISDETAAALSGISVDSRVSYDPGVSLQNRLDRLLDAVEKIAGSQTTMEIDGRPFGRLVREYV